jgi:hypothetical protein
VVGFLRLTPSFYYLKQKKSQATIMENPTNNSVKTQSIKKCPHCFKEVDPKASRCPHCQGSIYQWTFTKKFIAGGIGLIILFMVIGSLSPSSPTPATTSTGIENREINSMGFAEYVIKDLLKSPSTAEFSKTKAYELSDQKDVWVVNGYVDSQNGFGAMIRSSWEVQLDYRDGKGGEIKSVILDGKKIQ